MINNIVNAVASTAFPSDELPLISIEYYHFLSHVISLAAIIIPSKKKWTVLGMMYHMQMR